MFSANQMNVATSRSPSRSGIERAVRQLDEVDPGSREQQRRRREQKPPQVDDVVVREEIHIDRGAERHEPGHRRMGLELEVKQGPGAAGDNCRCTNA